MAEDRRRKRMMFLGIPLIYLLGAAAIIALLAVTHLAVLAALLGSNILLARIMRPFNRIMVGYAIELIGFSTVVAGTAYGPLVGAVFGIISLFANFITIRRLSPFTLAFVPIYASMGIAASALSTYPIFVAGMMLVVAYNLVSNAALIIFYQARIGKCIAFSVVNIVWSAFLFTSIAPALVRLA